MPARFHAGGKVSRASARQVGNLNMAQLDQPAAGKVHRRSLSHLRPSNREAQWPLPEILPPNGRARPTSLRQANWRQLALPERHRAQSAGVPADNRGRVQEAQALTRDTRQVARDCCLRPLVVEWRFGKGRFHREGHDRELLHRPRSRRTLQGRSRDGAALGPRQEDCLRPVRRHHPHSRQPTHRSRRHLERKRPPCSSSPNCARVSEKRSSTD